MFESLFAPYTCVVFRVQKLGITSQTVIVDSWDALQEEANKMLVHSGDTNMTLKLQVEEEMVRILAGDAIRFAPYLYRFDEIFMLLWLLECVCIVYGSCMWRNACLKFAQYLSVLLIVYNLLTLSVFSIVVLAEDD